MIDMDMICEETRGILAMLDASEWPECAGYLQSVMGDEGITEGPYAIASTLLDCDRPQKLPPFLIDYITLLYQTEVADDNNEAMNDLGAVYYDGHRGFEQSFAKAVYYYNMAAEHGNRQAQENLGYCYYYGRNMPVDYEKAFHYFALGAFDGHLISLYKIGDMYANGYYVKKNEKEAFLIYMHCLDTMTQQAEGLAAGPIYLRLGNMFLNGTGVEANAKSALVCYQKAEAFLHDMVKDGKGMYRKSMFAAIEGQRKAREKLLEELGEDEAGDLFD